MKYKPINPWEKAPGANHYWIAELEKGYFVLVKAPEGSNNEEYVREWVKPLFRLKIVDVCSAEKKQIAADIAKNNFNVDLTKSDFDHAKNICPLLFKTLK